MSALLELDPQPLSGSMADGQPMLNFFYLDPLQAAQFVQMILDPSEQTSPVFHYYGINSPSYLPMNASINLHVQYANFIDLQQRVNISSFMSFAGQYSINLDQIESLWQEYLAWLPESAAEERCEWRGSDGMQYWSQSVCLSPATFSMQIIREVSTYSFSHFLSDLGGGLSLLSILFTICFPFIFPMVRPRTFAGVWIANHAKSCSNKDANRNETELKTKQQGDVAHVCETCGSRNVRMEPTRPSMHDDDDMRREDLLVLSSSYVQTSPIVISPSVTHDAQHG